MDKISRSPQQQRSRVTTQHFVKAAMKLLEKQTYAELSVVELAKTAKRSVGTFYQRFGSKEEFLKVLITEFLETGVGEEAATRWEGRTAADIFAKFLGDSYYRILKNRNLWHAALGISSSDPSFWTEFGDLRGRRLAQLVAAPECAGGGYSLSCSTASSTIRSSTAPAPCRLGTRTFFRPSPTSPSTWPAWASGRGIEKRAGQSGARSYARRNPM